MREFIQRIANSNYGLHWCLFIVSALLYLNTWSNDVTYGDEQVATQENEFVARGISSIPDVFLEKGVGLLGFFPLTKASYAIEQSILNSYPPYSHFINILIHAFTVVLLFGLLGKMLPKIPVPIRFIALLIFAVYPLHTSVVDSLHGRSELLAVFFIALSLRSLFSWVENGKARPMFGTILWAFVALLAHPSIAVWFLVPIYVLVFIQRKDLGTIAKTIACFLFVLLIYGSYRIGNIENAEILGINNPIVLVEDAGGRMASAIYAAGMYLKMLAYPFQLCSCYGLGSMEMATWQNPLVYVSLVLFAVLGLVAFLAFKKAPLLSLGAFIVVITIIPFTNILWLQPELLNEKVLYGATFGFSIMLAAALGYLFKIRGDLSVLNLYQNRPVLRWTISLLVAVLIYTTFNRNFDWLINYTLTEKDVVSCEGSARMHYLRGRSIIEELQFEVKNRESYIHNAEKHLVKSIAIHRNWAVPHNELGELYLHEKNDAFHSINSFLSALEIDSTYEKARMNLALASSISNNLAEAMKQYAVVLRQNPEHKKALNEIISLYFVQGYVEEAELVNKRFFQLHPDAAEPYIHQGNILLSNGDTLKAIDYFQEAIERDEANVEFIEYVDFLKREIGLKAPSNFEDPNIPKKFR